MTLITRLSRLFRADFHAVLDRIEEPETLLRQAIREMEEEIACQEQAMAERLDGARTELYNLLTDLSRMGALADGEGIRLLLADALRLLWNGFILAAHRHEQLHSRLQ